MPARPLALPPPLGSLALGRIPVFLRAAHQGFSLRISPIFAISISFFCWGTVRYRCPSGLRITYSANSPYT